MSVLHQSYVCILSVWYLYGISLIFIWYQNNICIKSVKNLIISVSYFYDINIVISKGFCSDNGCNGYHRISPNLIQFGLMPLVRLTLRQWYGHLVSKTEDFTDIAMDIVAAKSITSPQEWHTNDFISPKMRS